MATGDSIQSRIEHEAMRAMFKTTYRILVTVALVLCISCASPVAHRSAEHEWILCTTVISEEKSGQREAAVFIWDVQKLINKEAPELHLLWHGLRGARPEAALSPDAKTLAVAYWNYQMDAKITSLVNLNTGHIEDLTKTPGEEYDLIWLNQNELFLYHAPHSPDLPDVLQVWNTKEKKLLKEFKWSDIFAPPSGAIPSFFSIAPSAIGNEIKVVGWVKENKSQFYFSNEENATVIYSPTYPYQIASLDKHTLKITSTVSYPAEINNLPSPPRQDLDYNGKDIYAFITQVSPIKSTWDSAINEIVVVKQGEDGKFTKIYEIPNSDKAVTFDSVLFINEDYLIYNFMSYKNGNPVYNIGILNVKNFNQWSFTPTWHGENIMLVNYRTTPAGWSPDLK